MTRLVWGGTLLWLVVVVCGSGLAWIAIDKAGSGVGSSAPSFTRTSSLPTPTTRTTGPARPPSNSPTHRPTAPTSSPAAPVEQTQVRSWAGAAGSLTVACTGSVERLRAATPANGWQVAQESGGPGLRVKFEREESVVVVDATCVAGVPRFHLSGDE